MLGLTVQNFVSAATSVAVRRALTHALVGRSANALGNFRADLTHGRRDVLLALSLVFAVVLVSQGVAQTFAACTQATTLERAPQGSGN